MAQEAYDNQEDEFDAADAAAAILSGYEHTRTADAVDQREYRIVPKGTACLLGFAGFQYQAAKGKSAAAILAKIDVLEPAEYADGSSNFLIRMSLNPVVGKNEDGSDKKGSGWDMTANQLAWFFAAVEQVSSAEGKKAMIDEVFAEFPNLEIDEVPEFHQALVENANEKLKGRSARTKSIGIDKGRSDGKGGTYQDRQSVGTLDYPKSK